MMGLAVLGVDFTVQFKFDVVSSVFGIGIAGEGQAGGFQVEINFGGVRSRNGEVDVVFFRVGVGRTLGPKDFWRRGFR